MTASTFIPFSTALERAISRLAEQFDETPSAAAASPTQQEATAASAPGADVPAPGARPLETVR